VRAAQHFKRGAEAVRLVGCAQLPPDRVLQGLGHRLHRVDGDSGEERGRYHLDRNRLLAPVESQHAPDHCPLKFQARGIADGQRLAEKPLGGLRIVFPQTRCLRQQRPYQHCGGILPVNPGGNVPESTPALLNSRLGDIRLRAAARAQHL
jgi:hypothetical protein